MKKLKWYALIKSSLVNNFKIERIVKKKKFYSMNETNK